ncbi:phenylalanine 4-monooxygenase [Mycolicibacterium mucogenicum]|uniref:Phenylalanine 4-monooxygenase n=1 Tax=Mycolicibacterium mucogenicum TaxID=56689 RepID=A0A1A0MPJ1_MYCMU|nr:phenylalanine 4-monooxygenase [Mycolicibacterium mucogenicum]OBA86981.1 phenylalanine 4-monooxygenase [Mycolicibacterium mucogenicum]TXH28308.1 MAG: phenylalanine 4-monooxygenase [Mycobacterium sp.]
MFEEAQLYAPVTRTGDDVTVHLAADHPGAVDPEYRARRNAIAALAMDGQPGTPPPVATYTDDEQEVWRIACAELHRLHQRRACTEYLQGRERLGLPEDRIPQLVEVNEKLGPLTGFQYVPAAGLVPLREFYGLLADGIFHSTQYIRHHSVPLYTPEPDLIHEVVGHGNCLAHERFAALYRLAGQAAQRVKTTEALEFVSKVFWFSLEFGVVRQHGEVRTYGAGLLSSYGEIQQIDVADLRPLDIARMGVQTYDITHYQPILFCARGFSEIEDVVGGFFADVDDEMVARLVHDAAQVTGR